MLTWPSKLLPELLISADDTLFHIALLPILPCVLVLGFPVEYRLQPLCFGDTCFMSGVLNLEFLLELTRF